MKIIDAFIFYNELDMLHYRFSTLYDIVDYFIIVESTRTFSGKEKPLFYKNNIERFSKYSDKIIHIVVDDFINYPNLQECWQNEYTQRNAIDRGIQILEENNVLIHDDLIIIGDVDELPDDETLSIIKKENLLFDYANLIQDFYYYNLTCKNEDKWFLAKITSYRHYIENLERTSQRCRIQHAECHIQRGGWHLSYFGDAEFIQNKINNFSHQEFNQDIYTNLENIEDKIKKNVDLFSRSHERWQTIPVMENPYLPTNFTYFL